MAAISSVSKKLTFAHNEEEVVQARPYTPRERRLNRLDNVAPLSTRTSRASIRALTSFESSERKLAQIHGIASGNSYREIVYNAARFVGNFARLNPTFKEYSMKSSERQVIMKVFNIQAFRLSKIFKRMTSHERALFFRQKVTCLQQNYKLAQKLKVPVAKIFNLAQIHIDGLVVQEVSKPVEMEFESNDFLSKENMDILRQFWDIVKNKPEIHSWNVGPSSFAVDSDGKVRLAHFPTKLRDEDAKAQLDYSITEWTKGNAAATAFFELMRA